MIKKCLPLLFASLMILLVDCKNSPRQNPYKNNNGLQPSFMAMKEPPNYTQIKYEEILFDFGKIN